MQTSRRQVKTQAVGGGARCSGNPTLEKTCTEKACPGKMFYSWSIATEINPWIRRAEHLLKVYNARKHRHFYLFQWTARGAVGILGQIATDHVEGAFKQEEGSFFEILEMAEKNALKMTSIQECVMGMHVKVIRLRFVGGSYFSTKSNCLNKISIFDDFYILKWINLTFQSQRFPTLSFQQRFLLSSKPLPTHHRQVTYNWTSLVFYIRLGI